MKILIINGPNLNLLGIREPEIYGSIKMDDVLREIKEKYPQHHFDFYQSNIEGEIIDRLQKSDFDGLIINPGAYSHYSYAIADALKNIDVQKIEVHISNIYHREEFRHKSVTAAYTNAVLTGFGVKGYCLAVASFE